jgi:hypothetical protein
MAEKRKAPDAPDAARKRKAPTIDLTATDVTPAPAAPEPAPQAEPAAAAPAETPPETPPPPPPEEPPQAAAEPEAMPPPASPEAVGRERRAMPVAAMLLAGVGGGVIVAIIAAGLWYGGVLPAQQTQIRPDTQAQQQIAQLQQQVDALKNRPAQAAAADPKLAERLTALQTTIAPLTQRLSSAETAIKSGDTAVTALGKRIDDIAGNASQARQEADSAGKTVTQLTSKLQDLARNQASTVTRADIDTLQQKLSSLEQAENGARASIAQSTAAASATRLALAAQALRNAVTGGVPYRAELAQAKALGADENKLAPLAPFASSGVPSAAALAQQLRDLLPQMRKIAAPRAQASGSFLERLQANAGNLVRISPATAPLGDRPADVLARLDVDAAHNDVAAAAADIGKLPEAAQAPAKDWLARVKARQAALAASAELAGTTARALAPVPQ